MCASVDAVCEVLVAIFECYREEKDAPVESDTRKHMLVSKQNFRKMIKISWHNNMHVFHFSNVLGFGIRFLSHILYAKVSTVCSNKFM